MTEVVQLREEDYRELLKSVARTPKGRAFLREHAERARVMASAEVYRLVDDLRSAWQQQSQVAQTVGHVEVLRRELQDMSASISNARREIASLQPKDGGGDRINMATNELDAIVAATERASFEILNAAERMMDLGQRLRAAGAPAGLCDDLEAEVTNLFTACSFQDLTGQRTTKVVNALRYIEQRVTAMIGIWGGAAGPVTAPVPDLVDQRPDAHLLNGPTADGIDQGEIDRLLNGGAVAPSPPASSAGAASAPAKGAAPAADAAGADGPEPLGQNDIDALFG